MPQYNIALNDNGEGTITIFDGANIEVIDHTHPNFLRISTALIHGEGDLDHLLDASAAITVLDDRVSIVGDEIHFDGEPVHNNLTRTILRYSAEGRDTAGLVKFMERLNDNPSRRSREQLFNWTQSVDLTIDPDGFIVGYKGVTTRTDDTDFLDDSELPLFPLDEYPYKSQSSGHAVVDGIDVNGQIPAGIGAVIEMPRSEVQDDPNLGCSFGLHVGSYDYALTYARNGALLEVRFSPADVVSVPSDCSFQKLRCCRYEIVGIHEIERGDDLTDYEPEPDWEDDDAWEAFAPEVESSWLERFRSKWRKKG